MDILGFKNYTRREVIVHIIMYGLGVVLLPAGIVLTINSHFGAGGLDALNFAFGEFVHIPTSVAIFITGAIYMCIAAIIRKKPPRPLTFMASIFQGIFTDVWKIIFADVESTGIVSAVLLFLVGNVIIAAMAAPYFISCLPTNPADDMTLSLTERRIRISFAKIGVECCAAFLAFLLHGEVSVGTVLVILLLGPMIDFFQILTKKILDKINVRYGETRQNS